MQKFFPSRQWWHECPLRTGPEQYAANEYSLILTDCNMPVMNGYELTSEIRQRNTNIAVIALTADAFPEQALNCLSPARMTA